MAFSSVVEPLRAANVISGKSLYRWTTVATVAGKIFASNGMGIDPDYIIANAPAVDRIVLCSGGDADRIEADDAMAWLRRRVRAGAAVGAVADAAFLLARVGLLDGHACTLHWTSQPAFREAFPEIAMRRDLYVIDRQRFTSAGGIGSLDMMLEMIGRDCGPELAGGVAEWFLHSPLRSSADRSLLPLRLRSGIRDQLVLSAVGIMEDAVEQRLSMVMLANQLQVSPDRLERAFRSELGVAPSTHYRTLRLKRAADLLTHSMLSVGEVALSCGFASASSFTRAFGQAFGASPTALRRRPSISGAAPLAERQHPQAAN